MIRVFHVYFPGRTLLLVVSETLVVVLSVLPAAFVVFGTGAADMLGYQSEFLKLLLAVGVCMACMHYYDLYDSMVLHSMVQGATRVVQVLGSACVILACLYYVYPVVQISPDLLMIWVVLAGISLIAWRRLFLSFSQSERHAHKALLLGAGPLAAKLWYEIKSRPELGIRLTGYVEQKPAACGELHQLPHLGDLDQLPMLLKQYDIERVIITTENGSAQLPVESLLAAKASGVIVDDGPEFFEAVAGRLDLDSLRPTMLLFSEGFRLSFLARVYKRATSIVFSLLGLVLALPVSAILAVAVCLGSPGPAIFKQKRAGKDGKPFTLYKFRSMYERADTDAKPRPAQLHDSRCTPIGRWLRRTRLDELPQFLNILRGDMDLVGPRPFALDMENELAQKIPFYSRRWAVRPGATGWAQVRRGYNETLEDNKQKLTYDLYYIKNFSVGLDFLIVLETVKILLLGRGSR